MNTTAELQNIHSSSTLEHGTNELLDALGRAVSK